MRLEQLTFTRFIAAVAIVVYHFGSGAYPFNIESIGFIMWNANLGVSYFFILSGFIMVVAYSSSGQIKVGSYLKNRFARIYPVFFLSIILLLAHTYFFDPNFTIGIFKHAIFNLSLLQAWVPSKAMLFNGPAWSLSVEVLFYLIFPYFFNKFYTKQKLSIVVGSIVVFWLLFQILFQYLVKSPFNEGYPSASHALLFYFPLMHLSAFLAGNAAGVFFMKKLAGRTGRYDIPVILTIVVFLVIIKMHTGLNYHNGLLAAVIIPFIIFLSLNRGLISRFFRLKFLVFLGEISYGIYILQVPVMRLTVSIVRQLDITHDNAYLFYISLAMLIVVSALSYYFFETPVRNIIKSIRLKPLKLDDAQSS